MEGGENLESCLEKLKEISLPDIANEELGLKTIRCMVVGEYRVGKSHYTSSVLCALNQKYDKYTEYKESETSVTQDIKEFAALQKLENPEYNFSLLDSFGFEDGKNWTNVLIKALRGKYEEVTNTLTSDIAPVHSVLTNKDLQKILDSNDDDGIRSKMILAVVIVVDARLLRNEMQPNGKSGHSAVSLRMLFRLFTYLGYSPVVVVTFMDEIFEESLSLDAVETDEKWLEIQKEISKEGIPTDVIYPVVPVTQEMDQVKQTLVLKPLLDVIKTKAPKMLSQAMAVKLQKPLTLVAEDGSEKSYKNVEISLKSGSSFRHVQNAIADELQIDAEKIVTILVMKKNTDEWTPLINVRKGDKIEYYLESFIAEFSVSIFGQDDQVIFGASDSESKSLEILHYKVTEAHPNIKKRENIKELQVFRETIGWVTLTSRRVADGGIGKSRELRALLH